MLNRESENNNIRHNPLGWPLASGEKVCDLGYLSELMGAKKLLIRGIMDAFLRQIPEELKAMNDAIAKTDYVTIKNFAHTMKSSVSIMGISVLTPILQEMESIGGSGSGVERIKQLNEMLNLICARAIAEVEIEKGNYIEL